MKRFTAKQNITINGDRCGFEIEVEMTVSFTVSKFIPASNDGPAEEPAPDVNEVTFSRNGEDVTLPSWLIDGILDRDGFDTWLMSEANEQSKQAEEDHADHKREMRREA
ncbi:hypothetical protein [Ochrobactrum sp. EDr1-4]|jgi:hypothetical protein|uniref:hypothetical protein n=1 Tax=Ochrobactrum sp. EDr1-4 TaxID=3368622 RepID=UPI003B9E388D